MNDGQDTGVPVKKRNWCLAIIKKILLVFAGLIVLTGIVISLLLYTVFTPEKVTPVVLGLVNNYLDAQVECESVEITFFSTFPDLGILMKNGKIINRDSALRATGLPQDTLVSFRRCLVSFNPVAFLTDRKVIIKKLEIAGPQIYAFVNTTGNANWNILSPDTIVIADTIVVTDTIKEPVFNLSEMNISDVRIKDAYIIYDDRKQGIFAALDSLDLGIDGNMSKDSTDLDFKFGIKSITAVYGGRILTKRLPLKFDARMHSNVLKSRVEMQQASITIGTLAFNVKGFIQGDTATHLAFVDMELGLGASSLSELLLMIPEQYSTLGKKVVATGKFDSYCHIYGHLGKEKLPGMKLSLQLEEGSLRSARHPENPGIKKIELGADAEIDFTGERPSYVRIDKIFLQSTSSVINCSGDLRDIFTRPYVQAHIDGNIDFNRLSRDLALSDSMQMGGFIKMDLSGSFFMDEVMNGNYGKIKASGGIDVDDVLLKGTDGLDLFASMASVRLGSNVKDSIRGREVETLLRGNVDIDSISLDTGNGVLAKAGKLSVRFRTTAPRDSNTIAAVSTSFRSENIFLDMGDSVKALALKTSASLRMVPSPDNPKKPELIARINLDNLGARMPVAGGYINNASFQMRMKQRESGRRREQQHTRADSAWVQRFDSLRRQNQDSYLSFQLASEDARKLIRDMDLSGSFQCKDMNLRTPFFPLPVKMIQSELGFTTNSLSLTNTRFKAGVSDLMLTGSIEGIQQLLLRNGRLTARLGIESDTLDVNEIIRAIAAGTEFAGSDVNRRDSIAQVVFDDTNDLTGPSDTATGIFVIPRNIDFELDTKLKKAVFSNLLLDNVAGKVIIRNQSLRLPDLQLSSEVGNVDLSLVYKATDKKKANLGLDIKMDRIYIKELLGGFPMIDTLAPMLKSFEGVVSCNMAIMSELDEKSDFILPETSASCYLHGKNMVLLDGETFAEISKMLMFKNKKRNMIDSISVEFIMEDNSLMVFPFMVSIDRYTVGVGGVQNLDMSFDYHISVLKSPLPFKLGLNISGTPDKIKFRLAKAKYKDLFTPAKKQTLASVQVNLRQQMYDHLKKTIDEIINEPSATPSFKSRLMISEDLKQEYFKLDTTTVALPEEIPEESAVPSN